MDFFHIARNYALKKPNLYNEKMISCPFCNFKYFEAEKLLLQKHTEYPILWVKNKFPVIEGAHQTLIIETDSCSKNLTNFTIEYIQELFNYSLSIRKEMLASTLYDEVIFLKNVGKDAGGSIPHSHMQLIGLKKEANFKLSTYDDYYKEGQLLLHSKEASLMISKTPLNNMYEFIISWETEDFPLDAAYQLQLMSKFAKVFQNGFDYNIVYHEIGNKKMLRILFREITNILKITHGLQPRFANYDNCKEDFIAFLNTLDNEPKN